MYERLAVCNNKYFFDTLTCGSMLAFQCTAPASCECHTFLEAIASLKASLSLTQSVAHSLTHSHFSKLQTPSSTGDACHTGYVGQAYHASHVGYAGHESQACHAGHVGYIEYAGHSSHVTFSSFSC